MSSATGTVAPTVPLVHPVPEASDIGDLETHHTDAELAADYEAWLRWRGDAAYAEHPEPCPCEECLRLHIPELVQAVQLHAPAVEAALARFVHQAAIRERTYRTLDDGRTIVTFTFESDPQSDQLSLDECRVALTARDTLRHHGFLAEYTRKSPPQVQVTGYHGTPVDELRARQAAAPASGPGLVSTAHVQRGEERAA
jgi:hypothetical protein